MKDKEYIKSRLTLFDLLEKFECQREELYNIINSGKYTKYHGERLLLFLEATDYIKDIHEKYLKSKIDETEYILKLTLLLTEITKEEDEELNNG